jgi:hypothetical protein
MEQQPFRAIGSTLADITTHTATAAFTTGSFSYTPDQLRNIITKFLDLAASYRDSLINARDMAQVQAPGLEYASESHATAARAMGKAYLQSLEDSWRYCVGQAQKFQDTLHDYLGVERQSVLNINNAGPQDGI